MTDLTHLNTLQVPAKAKNYVEINTLEDLEQINTSEPYMFLGSGANVLFTKDYPGTVAKVNLDGITILEENDSDVLIEASGGQNWHELVQFSVENDFSGMENMALIPGTVAAAAIGNIAAYGQDQEDVFESLTAIDLQTKKSHTFTKNAMQYTYRDSALRNNPNKLFVSSVTYRLSKTPQFTLFYDAKRHQSLLSKLQQKFPETKNYTSHHVFEAVVEMRTEKLPDWRTTPNAGSFFKNPVVPKEKYMALKEIVPDLHAYPPEKLIQSAEGEWLNSVTQVKLPAGRMLDELGWRGKRIGNVGTHSTQALCVVNYGATGTEIYAFTQSMKQDLKKNYGVDLEYEVQII